MKKYLKKRYICTHCAREFRGLPFVIHDDSDDRYNLCFEHYEKLMKFLTGQIQGPQKDSASYTTL